MAVEHPPLRAAAIRGFNQVSRIGSGRAARWLRSINIDTSESRWEENLVSYRSAIELVEGVSSLEGIPDLGLSIAETQDISVLGALGVAMQNGRTLRESIQLCEKYIHYHSPACELRLETASDGSGFVSFDIAMTRMPCANQSYELSLGLGYGFAKAMSGGNRSVCKEVWFKHQPIASLSAYRQVFGVTPKFGMPRVGFVFSARDLDRPNQTRSDVLSDISLHFLQTQQGSRAASTTFEVRRIVSRMIGSETVNQAEVAAELCITVRTLQRRLRAENTCFDAILDDIRRGLTSDYLRQTTLSLSQVAERLQFNDTSAFTRACHRWFGSPPKSVRQVFLAEDRQRRREVHGSLVGALADNLNPVVS